MIKINKLVKRIMDLFGGLIGVVILIPLTILVYILNFIYKEKGPIIYVHERIGKDGKTFRMYKFRSMVIDAEEKLEKLLSENEEMKIEFEKTFKLKHDPRIIKIGRILRKTSLDEFPQFINVIKGEMSLVGPRPIVKKEWDEYYKEDGPICFSVKPGITGIWQAYARSHSEDYQSRIELDKKYIQKANIFFDIKIIVITIFKVVLKDGAY